MEKELTHAGLTDYFEYVVSATSDLGMVKKEERFYRTLAANLGVSPAISFMWAIIRFSITRSLARSASNATITILRRKQRQRNQRPAGASEETIIVKRQNFTQSTQI